MKARWWTRKTAIVVGILLVIGALAWVGYGPALGGQQLPLDNPAEQLSIELEHQDELHGLSTDRWQRLESRVGQLEQAIIGLDRGSRTQPYDDRLDRLEERIQWEMDQMRWELQQEMERR